VLTKVKQKENNKSLQSTKATSKKLLKLNKFLNATVLTTTAILASYLCSFGSYGSSLFSHSGLANNYR